MELALATSASETTGLPSRFRDLANELREEVKAILIAMDQEVRFLEYVERNARYMDRCVLETCIREHRERIEAHKKHIHELYVDGSMLVRASVRHFLITGGKHENL